MSLATEDFTDVEQASPGSHEGTPRATSRSSGCDDASGMVRPSRSRREPERSSGDADFERWYREQHPRVLAALTVASGSPDIAAESTDEAFVRAYERWDRVRHMESPGGWLHRVAFNDLRRRHRRRSIERELLRRRPPQPEAAPPALEPHVWEAVRQLPRRQRTAVALRYVLDLPEAEVARFMGVTRGSASASLTAARRQLEGLLGAPSTGGGEEGTSPRAVSPVGLRPGADHG